MPTDPGHEFLDVVEQLTSAPRRPAGTGSRGSHTRAITNEGFVANYATTTTEIVTPGAPRRPTTAECGDVMKCFDTPRQLPVIHQLATEFADLRPVVLLRPGADLAQPVLRARGLIGRLGRQPDRRGHQDLGRESTLGHESGWRSASPIPSGSIYDSLRASGIGVAHLPGPRAVRLLRRLLPAGGGAEERHVRSSTPRLLPIRRTCQGPTRTRTPSSNPTTATSRRRLLHGRVVAAPDGRDGPWRGADQGDVRGDPGFAAVGPSLLIITYDEHGGFYDSGTPARATPPDDGGPAAATNSTASCSTSTGCGCPRSWCPP